MSGEMVLMDDGVRLHLEAAGPESAPVVLFAHSVGCDLSLWDHPFARLGQRYRVVRYDARGHGRSDAPTGDYPAERLGRDALAVLDWAGASQAIVCGLSLGGATALWLALNAPERLSGMVLANSSARLGTAEGWSQRMTAARTQGMEALADFSMTRFFSDTFRERRPDIVAAYRRSFAATPAEGFAGCCAVLRDGDFRQRLSQISTPTLVIGGALDIPTPPADARLLASAIPGAVLTQLDTGHLSAVEDGPAFTAVVERWLAASGLAG